MANILARKKNLKPATPIKKTREDYAEDALYREVWEDVNNEKTIAFFKKYSKQMIGTVLAVLIVVAGYQIGVRTYRANQMAQAVNYETALEKTDINALASIGKDGRGANADLALFQAYALDKSKDKDTKSKQTKYLIANNEVLNHLIYFTNYYNKTGMLQGSTSKTKSDPSYK